MISNKRRKNKKNKIKNIKKKVNLDGKMMDWG